LRVIEIGFEFVGKVLNARFLPSGDIVIDQKSKK
jgi:hypothetical protein